MSPIYVQKRAKMLNKSTLKFISVCSLAVLMTLNVAGNSAEAAKKSVKTAESRGGKSSQEFSPDVKEVSDLDFNTFVFSHAIKKIHFPSGSPVREKPVFLAGATQVMLQFNKPSNDKPFQFVVELENQEVLAMRLHVSKVAGATHYVNGAKPQVTPTKKISTENSTSGTPNAADIELLKILVSTGTPPETFEATTLPAVTVFDKFSVVPISAWTDGDKRLMIFSLVSKNGQTAVVSPPQFYRDKITAVMIDGDSIDIKTSPTLFIVEDVSSDQ